MRGSTLFMLLFGIGLIATPITLLARGAHMSPFAATIMIIAGLGMVIAAGVTGVIGQLYAKTRADEAFVRTGMGGLKVIKDGGALVLPVVHRMTGVPLRTYRQDVLRTGPDALLTSDKLRADIRAEFFIRVMPNDADIINAARSLGDRAAHEKTIKALIEDKLVSALRTVAATRTLEDLNSKRDEFVQRVMESVTADLKHNGFTLETATISALDQADTASLRDDNVFDAEGKLTISRVTEEKRTERNSIERERERERLAQDVEAKKKMLALKQEQAQAEAAQQAAIKKANAEQEQEARECEIEAQRAVEVAQARQEEAVEVADRKKKLGIARAEAEQAEAEEARSKAVAEAERASQRIETAKVEETAERDKQREVIAAQSVAEQAFVAAQRKADAEAYQLEKQAGARKAAASAEAEAVRTQASAAADAALKRAEGAQAESMVPVAVEQERVAVKRREADVEIMLLEQRERFGRAGVELQIRTSEIEASREVGIAAAHAMGEALSSAHMQFWGSPEMLSKVTSTFMDGQSVAQALNGFDSLAAPRAKEVVDGLMSGGVGIVKGLANKLGVSEDDLQTAAASKAHDGAGNSGASTPQAARKQDAGGGGD